ncbi:MAG: pyridoxal phosphate-dependent aminotransferase [Candidatus Aminicenantes bacterium]|nr:pyridoxal phosphate-dependent aminotransferase [Candidatus Aminicenantes bacterium]
MKPVRLSARAWGLEKSLLRQIADLAGPDCINLGLGEPAFPTPRAVLDGVSRNIGRWPLGYSANAGLPELRSRIAARAGGDLDPSCVCVTSGSEEALFLALSILVDPGDEILIPEPGFPSYAGIVRLWGGRAVSYPLRPEDGFTLRSESLAPLLSEKTKAIVINSPSNPTGAVHPASELQRLAGILDERNISAISDEVYRDLYYGNDRPASIRTWLPDTIVVDSLSKTSAMTGWRLGWCITPPGLAQAVTAVHQLAVTCASVPAQRAALLVLEGAADEERRANLIELKRRRQEALSGLKVRLGLPFNDPDGAFYVFVDVSSWKRKWGNSLQIARDLVSRAKVVTIPGIAFGSEGEGFLRFSFAGTSEDFAEGLDRIARLRSKA